ncbi:hypothetical protein AAGG74_18870 [Bacillus mexicanus]|uniref:hypothetical protein n=1 Tax=Bacillus mexicanus TaxID=2834415 RepID=UPI003D1951F6
MSQKVKLIKGGKEKDDSIIEIPNDGACLILPTGERYHLDSFIISGETSEGDRIAFTWNSSLEEAIVYQKALSVQIDDKVREAFRTKN